jgi:hypothetical protein
VWHHRSVAALDELAAFVLDYCDAHNEDIGSPGSSAVAMILHAPDLPDRLAKQAALYGFAAAVSAAHADGFDPRWNPRG